MLGCFAGLATHRGVPGEARIIRRRMHRESQLLFPIRQPLLREEHWPDSSAERDHVDLAAPWDDQRTPEGTTGLVVGYPRANLLDNRDADVADELLQIRHAVIMS